MGFVAGGYGGASPLNDDVTVYTLIVGSAGIMATTETNSKMVAPSNATLKNAHINIKTNGITNDFTVTLRINDSDGNQVITVSASTTGVFADTTNTDSITIGDEINWKLVTIAGGTTATFGATMIEVAT